MPYCTRIGSERNICNAFFVYYLAAEFDSLTVIVNRRITGLKAFAADGDTSGCGIIADLIAADYAERAHRCIKQIILPDDRRFRFIPFAAYADKTLPCDKGYAIIKY